MSKMKKYKVEIKNIKNIISKINYGIKTKDGIRPSVCKKNVLKNYKKTITNKLILNHCENKETLYFYGDENNRNKNFLIMIDIDVKKKENKGTKEGAKKFAEHLKEKITDFYYEDSTNGNGIHGYLIVDKCDKNCKEINNTLKKFENYLENEKEKTKADIEIVEIKGKLHEIEYEKGKIKQIKFGSLAKIPRNIEEFYKYKSKIIKIDNIEKKYNIEKKLKEKKEGSLKEKLIKEEILSNINKFEEISKNIFGEKLPKAGKFAITHKDIAITLILLMFFKDNKNKDNTLPTNRAMELWKSLYNAEDIDRAWNHHRWKEIRNMLSKKGLIYWIDNKYTIGNKELNTKGIACKWEISKKLYMYIKTYFRKKETKERASFMDTKSITKVKVLSLSKILGSFKYKKPILLCIFNKNTENIILNKANNYIKRSFCCV